MRIKKYMIQNKETTWVEFNELVFNRENPKLIYKNKDANAIFRKIRKGSLVYYKRNNLIWLGEVKRVSGRIGLDISII